jgi:cyclopropane fatty-acyl-phospholipid synthase-like methyltransferase
MNMKLLSLVLFVLLSSPAAAQQPASGQSRGNRSAEEYVKLLESESRISGLQVSKVVGALNVRAGQRVCDLGAGSGLFTRPLAERVGDGGIVYAVDIDAELLKHIERAAQAGKHANIRPILGAEDDPKLPEPVDLIVIIDTLHHIANRASYLKGLKKHLKSDGRIAILDFSKNWPAGHEKMIYSVDDLDGWMRAAGFRRSEKHDFLENNFFVVYR